MHVQVWHEDVTENSEENFKILQNTMTNIMGMYPWLKWEVVED